MDKKDVAKVVKEGFTKSWWDSHAHPDIVANSTVGKELQNCSKNLIGKDGLPIKTLDESDVEDAVQAYSDLDDALKKAKKLIKVGKKDTKDAIDKYREQIQVGQSGLQGLLGQAMQKRDLEAQEVRTKIADLLTKINVIKDATNAGIGICKDAVIQMSGEYQKAKPNLHLPEAADSLKDALDEILKSHKITELYRGLPKGKTELAKYGKALNQLPQNAAWNKEIMAAAKVVNDVTKLVAKLEKDVAATLAGYKQVLDKATLVVGKVEQDV